MATLNRNLLTTFTKAAKDAVRTFPNYTDETNAELVAEKTAALRADILPQVRDLADTTSEPIGRDRIKKAIGVDYTDPASVAAVPMKWDQVTQLMNAGQTWASIIDQADLHMLAAIVENAPIHLSATGERASNIANIDLMAAQRAAQLGHNPAKAYLNEQAQRAYNQVVATKIVRQLTENRGLTSIEAIAENWDREAETAAAKVLGEPTPNERDMAAQQAERAQQFEQETAVSRFAPGESPAELAAKVPRGY